MKVGFIRWGNMGSGMAVSLIRAGHEVTVFHRTPGKRRIWERRVRATLPKWRTSARATG
jgi:3-hydroxyisobutyrate dehydrogenase-like beta-hydroxyacid dehydrogenase